MAEEISKALSSSFLDHARILFVLLSPIPSPSASWARIGYFANFLREHGMDVTIVGAFSATSMRKAGSIDWNGIKILNIIPVIILSNFIVQILNIAVSLLMSIILLALTRPKVVIISVPSSANPVAFYIVARLFGRTVITDYRDQWEDYSLQLSRTKLSKALLDINKNILGRCYRNSHIVVTVAEPLANSLNRRGVKNENIKIIQNGADITIFRPKDKALCREKIGISKDDFVLIYSGHVGAYYRLDVLLHAMKQSEKYDKNIKLLIAGHGSSLRYILSLAQDMGLQNNVMYIGKIMNKEELADAICAADIGIIPYDSNLLWKNAIPAKSLEYLACGLPIIATTYTDSLLGKIIINNELGLVARPENIGSLSEAINKLRVESKIRANASAKAIALVDQNYNRHKLASQFLSIVLKCLNHSG